MAIIFSKPKGDGRNRGGSSSTSTTSRRETEEVTAALPVSGAARGRPEYIAICTIKTSAEV